MVTNGIEESAYLCDALSYSSKRRLLFVKLYQEIGRELGFAQLDEDFVFNIMERIHASASIIDDMLDNDASRKGYPSYYIRHGQPVAAFASLNLMIGAVQELVKMKSAGMLLTRLRNMINAEEADVGLRQRDNHLNPIEWYVEVVSKKITEELLLILDLCSQGSETSNTRLRSLVSITCSLGQFIQYCDDHRDVLALDPFDRSADDQCYVLTYSLPLAIHMTNNGSDFEGLVGSRTPKDIAKEVLLTLRRPKNVSDVETFIANEHCRLITSIAEGSLSSTRQLLDVVELIRTEAYWEKDYHEVIA